MTTLNRETRQESAEKPTNAIPQMTNASHERNSSHKLDNLAFYNRHKPSSINKRASDSSLPIKRNFETSKLSTPKPENRNQTPTFIIQAGRDRRKADLGADKTLTRNTSTPSFYKREEGEVAPNQSFYVVQEKRDTPGAVVVRRGVLGRKQFEDSKPTTYRHSIYTDQPTTYPNHVILQRNHVARDPNSPLRSPADIQSWMQGVASPDQNEDEADLNRSGSTPDSVVAERNRKAFYKVMHAPTLGDVPIFEKIVVSPPYNL